MKVDCCNHLFNPFSQGSIKLKTWQKGVAITSLIALAPLLLFPGLIAFWGLTYYFKATQINLHEQDASAASRANAVSREVLSSTPRNDGQSVSDDSDIDEDEPMLPFSNLSPLEQSHEELEHLHYSQKIQNCFNHLHSSNTDKIAIFERLKKQVPSWQEYLGFLSQHQFEDFNLLFGIALDTENPEIYMDFIKALDPGQLNEHLKSLNNCQIIFEDNVLPVHKTLLRRISPYFDSMFSSSMSEAKTNEIHLQEKEDYELFEELLPSVMDVYFFDKRLDLSADNLTKYLELANKYQLSQLEETCKTWIFKNFDSIDCYNLFDLADQYCLESVKSTLVQDILQTYSKSVGFTQSQKQKLSQWLPRIGNLEIQDDLGDEVEPLLNLCTNLHTLNITLYDKRTIKLLKELPSLGNLAVTSINHWNAFSEHDIKDLQGLPITSISITGSMSTVITDQGLEYLKDLPLESLVLACLDQITDHGLEHLKDLPIKRLILRDCKCLTNNGLAHLKKLPLESLVLASLDQITDHGLEHLKDLPLKRLILRDCKCLTNNGLAHLKKLPLESLVLKSLHHITNQGLEHLKDLPLKSLTIRYHREINDNGVAHLKNLPLESLVLESITLTHQGLEHLKELPLEFLALEAIDGITDRGFEHLKDLSLKSLALYALPYVTDQGLAHLEELPLKSFTIEKCGRITGSHIANLRKAMPHTRIVFLKN